MYELLWEVLNTNHLNAIIITVTIVKSFFIFSIVISRFPELSTGLRVWWTLRKFVMNE